MGGRGSSSGAKGGAGSAANTVNNSNVLKDSPTPKTKISKAEAQRLEVISKFDRMFDSDFSKRTLKSTLGISSFNDLRDKGFDKDRGRLKGWVSLDVGSLKDRQKLALKNYLQQANLKFDESGTWILHVYK